MKNLVIWLIIGLAIRLALMPLGIHPDIRAYNFAAELIAQQGHLLTFYDFISQLPRDDIRVAIYGDGQFNYPPLAYLSHAVFNFLLHPLYPPQALERLLFDYDSFRGSLGSGWLLILLKLPYLLADIGCLLLIRKIIGNQKIRDLASILWIFNPLTLYSAYLMAQFDIFIAFCVLLAMYWQGHNRTSLAAVALGLAAGFKPFPLIMLPFLGGSKIKNLAVGLLTYLAIILPYLHSTAFKHYALFASQSDKPFYAKIMVSGSQYLPLFVVALVGVWWWFFFRPKALPYWAWLSVPLVLFFSLTHFHPQWLTWLAPFLVLAAAFSKAARWPILALLGAYAFIVFLFDPSLNFGMVGVPFDFTAWVSPYLSAELVASIARGLFAGCSLAIIGVVAAHEGAA